MWIEELRLRDFRNYGEITLQPHRGMNLFFGQNGSGKTNLLEAAHYCALGKSHRTNADREVVRRGCPMGACSVRVAHADGSRSEVTLRLAPEEHNKKQVWIDRKRAARLADLMGHLGCVIFSPEDLSLVREGPAVRRRLMDMFISQLSPRYFIALQRYSQALESRNALLRDARREGALRGELMTPYEELMSQAAGIILPERARIMEQLSALAAEKYAAIAGREGEDFSLRYLPCMAVENFSPEKMAEKLAQRREEEVFRGSTGFGPHREDLEFTLRGREMKPFASQGQVRTAALAVRLAQLALFTRQRGESPVLLLDDVMSELDKTRRARLLEEISGVQTFVTCTDESDLDDFTDKRTWQVSLDGEARGCVRQTRAGAPEEAVPEDPEPDFS